MPARIRYRGHVYQIQNGNWRGPDGHVVHLLTWITDDLSRLPETRPTGPNPDAEAARKVVQRLGEEAELIRDVG